LASAELGSIVAEHLLSSYEIELPAHILKQAQDFADATFSLRALPNYQQKVLKRQAELFPNYSAIHDPGNNGIAMSYDFHINIDGVLKLIEVNTNAAFLALGTEMYEFRQKTLPIADFSREEIKLNIQTEMSLHQKKNPKHKVDLKKLKVAIVDDHPPQQRLFAEFLVYQEWFQAWGWKTEIKDREEPFKADFIYNRSTDFYLEEPQSQQLKKYFQENTAALSPNPYEYAMLADKERMIEWSAPGFLEECGLEKEKIKALQKNLPKAHELTIERAEEIWTKRKHYFFKPLRAFGAKQSYRGASISRKAFDEIAGKGFIAQEFVPAPERIFETPEGQQNFKFDLRFYAYQNRIQNVVARVYQGQVTNLRTPHGGFTPVTF